MTTRLPPSFALHVLGVLLTFTGTCLILAPFLFSPEREIIPLCWGAGTLMVAAGIGLRRARAWGWYLAFVVAVTGLAVVVIRLSGGDDENWWVLAGTLVTDLIMVLILFRDRTQGSIARGA